MNIITYIKLRLSKKKPIKKKPITQIPITQIPRKPWVASVQYGMHFILSADNEIIIRADHLPYELLEHMAESVNKAGPSIATITDELKAGSTTNEDYLEDLENMARQHCFTDKKMKTYQGVPEINITDSGGLSTDAEALRTLAEHGRFRIVREHGRIVVGFWPENEPEKVKN